MPMSGFVFVEEVVKAVVVVADVVVRGTDDGGESVEERVDGGDMSTRRFGGRNTSCRTPHVGRVAARVNSRAKCSSIGRPEFQLVVDAIANSKIQDLNAVAAQAEVKKKS
jgi:hypothetical protein